jgi:hypothetical protein
MNTSLGLLGGVGSVFPGPFGPLTLALLVVWTLVWKGLALWRAAREESKWWFVILLVVNTLGILEILYFFVFSRTAREGRDAQKASHGGSPSGDASGPQA